MLLVLAWNFCELEGEIGARDHMGWWGWITRCTDLMVI